MLITDIKTQERNTQRENIYLDGKFAFAISAEFRFISKIKIGDILTEKKVRELTRTNQVEQLFFSAQKFLAVRPRSKQEIIDNLKKKLAKGDFMDPPIVLAGVLNKLEKLDFVNDTEFAKWWVEQRQKFRPRGEQAIRFELYSKGIDRGIIDLIFDHYKTPENEIERIARKRLSSYKNLSKRDFRQKMSVYLARRGYKWDEISPVVDSLLREI